MKQRKLEHAPEIEDADHPCEGCFFGKTPNCGADKDMQYSEHRKLCSRKDIVWVLKPVKE